MPPSPSLCYKPFMRKWMRDRLKRRKKNTEAAEAPSQAPLQPAYFEAGAQAPEPVEVDVPVPEPEVAEVEPVDTPGAASPSVQPASGNQRRRRRRGGRGRGRSKGQQIAPAAPAPEAPASVSAPAPSSPPKGTVILAIGLPGSGKSSWFKRNNINPLSSDMLRTLLFDDATEQRFQDLVFSNLRSMLKARLIARRPLNYVDATNLTPQERHSWIKLSHDFGYDVQAVYFDVPTEVCLERNRKRERQVEEAVLRRMADKLKAPTFEEGFTKITVVRVKAKPLAED